MIVLFDSCDLKNGCGLQMKELMEIEGLALHIYGKEFSRKKKKNGAHYGFGQISKRSIKKSKFNNTPQHNKN